jgi:hypothetical protein
MMTGRITSGQQAVKQGLREVLGGAKGVQAKRS